MNKLLSEIKTCAEQIHQDVIEKRRHIHMYPELSFHEAQTSVYVRQELEKMGIVVKDQIGGYGLVGMIQGGKGEGKTVALRADMDALPIQEANDVPYKSQHPGIMHACGHDVHTSSLLGTAYILQQMKSYFKGQVKLIFQPAEERIPGGASLMIKDGVLQNPEVSSIIGQHVLPYMDCGKIGIRAGTYMASADEIYMTVRGKGGHAASPNLCIDPVVITAQMITALQQVISRSDPRLQSVLSFGRIIADGATNVIPDEVYIEGTFRAMNEEWRAEAHQQIRSIAEGIARSFGASVDLEIRKGYPVLYNEENLSIRTREAIVQYIGEENVVDLDLWMGAEDFAYYTHEIPGCFYRLGTKNEAKGLTHGLHTPKFDIDEEAMAISTGLMAWIAIQTLEAEN